MIDKEPLNKEIIKLSVHYQILSELTAFLLVIEKKTVDPTQTR